MRGPYSGLSTTIEWAWSAIPSDSSGMRQPGNWHEPCWDPQFIYWESVKAACFLYGYEVIDDIGIAHAKTGEA